MNRMDTAEDLQQIARFNSDIMTQEEMKQIYSQKNYEIKKLKEENEKLKKENKELNDRRANFYLHFTEYVYEYDIQSFDEWLEMEGLKRIFNGKIDEIISD